MPKYRKKPVVIEARQFTGGKGYNALLDWINEHAEDRTSFAITDCGKIVGLGIETLEGTMRADVGDWIIEGVSGEFYPCKPDIFAQTYELVEDTAA